MLTSVLWTNPAHLLLLIKKEAVPKKLEFWHGLVLFIPLQSPVVMLWMALCCSMLCLFGERQTMADPADVAVLLLANAINEKLLSLL